MLTCSNLPNEKIKMCLIGECCVEEINELSRLGIKSIPLKRSPYLDEEINYHADILAFNLGNRALLLNQGSIGEETLKNAQYSVKKLVSVKSPYPNDVALNAAYIGDNIICNKKHTSKDILSFADERGINIIHTNQGYAKCNLCVVSDNAVITEDDGLAYLLKNYQSDVLKLEPGHVYLSEHHHGFIGGASAKLSETELYFSGDLSRHPDYNKIITFLDKYNVTPIYNPKRNLRDFGGIVAL